MSNIEQYDKELIAQQTKFVKELIEFNGPLDEIKKLDFFGPIWDEQPEGFYFGVLTRQHITSVLQRFIQGEISAIDVYRWGLALAGTETIDFEKGYNEAIIYSLDCIIEHIPSINFLITQEHAYRYIKELEKAPYDIHEED